MNKREFKRAAIKKAKELNKQNVKIYPMVYGVDINKDNVYELRESIICDTNICLLGAMALGIKSIAEPSFVTFTSAWIHKDLATKYKVSEGDIRNIESGFLYEGCIEYEELKKYGYNTYFKLGYELRKEFEKRGYLKKF